MRRFTRLTNMFSKKFENHVHMVALYAVLSFAKTGGPTDTSPCNPRESESAVP
jgi:hypothetical protein